jgi:hypothetical protein
MNDMAKSLASKVVSRPKLAAGFALVGVLIVVILQNLEPVTLDFLLWNLGPFSKLWLILGSMAVGAGLAEAVRLLLRSR